MDSTSNRSTRLRYPISAVVACAALATQRWPWKAAAAGSTSVTTVHLVGHETQSKVLSQGGFGDEVIFTGILDNAAGGQPGGHLRGRAYLG